ncbi:DUF547 domain-containing protein [Ulvibacterium sp.]|uniref:DUF547 domain-containing protein n=1 Tax=Ulvibacterium sp. TaxID=2665914 RepID=UPI003BA84B01
MTLKPNRIVLLVLVLLSSCTIHKANLEKTDVKTTDLNTLSQEFLQTIKDGKDTEAIQDRIARITMDELTQSLVNDAHKLAFWINIYNAYIQVILMKNPEAYEDKGNFFKKEQIPIAGELLSFEKIEHGIIRKSRWSLGQGHIRKWFPNKLERKLRVDKRDYRVHFALNCGAKDCPPVSIYYPEELEVQLNKGTELFLKQNSDYHPEKNEVAVTSLFNWFRGDFGGKQGIKKILKEFEVIPTTQNINVSYKNYDWTLDLNNWITL